MSWNNYSSVILVMECGQRAFTLSQCNKAKKPKKPNQFAIHWHIKVQEATALHDWILLLYFKGLIFTVVTKSIINGIKNILLVSPKITNIDNLVHITVLLLNSQSFVCLSKWGFKLPDIFISMPCFFRTLYFIQQLHLQSQSNSKVKIISAS